ncbi:hypothetical protein XELAEV_18033596mg [Xenopus laevis]|uniref:Uncharacterized protein n=1 Tax=Xenopus laevis TaxID=8355 RepID=A0A974HEK0_XENLA|nr:hypothetical protein XELAEV_18033596mg [Xenopus laevis]
MVLLLINDCFHHVFRLLISLMLQLVLLCLMLTPPIQKDLCGRLKERKITLFTKLGPFGITPGVNIVLSIYSSTSDCWIT